MTQKQELTRQRSLLQVTDPHEDVDKQKEKYSA
jgi:hypothetical protein